MTDMTNSGAIAAKIERLRRDLDAATAAIPVIGKAASTKAAELEQSLAEAQAKLADALGNELLEAQKARLANFSDIRVDWNREDTSIIHCAYKIKYTRLIYDGQLRDSVPKELIINGFGDLPEDAYEYLVTVRPDAIPAPIMALCRDDPHRAFDIYFAAQRRGYFKSKAAA